MAFLSDCTTTEERGRVAGITILEAFVIAFLTLTIVEILELGTISTIILVTIIRSISFLALIVDKNEKISEKEKPGLVKSDYREFVFYLIPWIMFVVAASMASNVITAYTTNDSISNTQSTEELS